MTFSPAPGSRSVQTHPQTQPHPQPPPGPRQIQRWIHVSIPLLIAFSVAQLSKSSIGVFLADSTFRHQFGLDTDPGAGGWLTSLFLYPYGLALLGWGFLLKRVGPRRAMLAGTFLWTVALALSATAGTLTELFGTRILLAVGEACFYPVAHTLTARWFPLQERARANASWLSGIFVGSALGSGLTTAMLTSVGWRASFLIQAGIAAVLALGLVALLLRDRPEDQRGISQAEIEHIRSGQLGATDTVPVRGPQSAFRNYRYWLTMLMYVGTSAPFYGLVTWAPLYLQQERHLKLGDIGTLLTVANVLSIVVMLAVGRVSDRTVRRAGWAAAGFVIQGAGLVGIALTGDATAAAVFLFLGLAGNAWCVVTNWSLLHNLMPTEQAESATGVFSSLTNLVGAALPGLMGTLLSATGGYTAGFGLCALAVVVSFGCCLVLRPQGY